MANNAKTATTMTMSRPLIRDQAEGTAGAFPAQPGASAAAAEMVVGLPQAGQVAVSSFDPASVSNVCPQ